MKCISSVISPYLNCLLKELKVQQSVQFKSGNAINSLRYSAIIFMLLLLSGCSSVSQPDAAQMFENLSASFPPIWEMATALAYVLGFFFAFKSIMMLKTFAENRTMMSQHGNLKGPVVLLLVASALIFSPGMYQSLLLTTFGSTQTSPLDYSIAPSGVSYDAMKAIYQFIQLCGLFSFIRGWIHLTRLAEQHAQPQTFSKALTHIVAGLMAINIVGTKNLLFATFGLN